MMVDVHLQGGEIVRCPTRGALIALIKRNPAEIDFDNALRVWIDRRQGEGWVICRMQYVKRQTIAWIEQIIPSVAAAFLTEHAPGILETQRQRALAHHRAADPMSPAGDVVTAAGTTVTEAARA